MSDTPDMHGKIVMITGANSGIGKATALALARMGATIVMVCRNRERGEIAQIEIKESTENQNIDLLIADLSSQQDIWILVDNFKNKYQKLHVLTNNAGIVLRKRQISVDGIEVQFAVNFLAPFLLTNLLLDILKASTPARVINVSSAIHKRGHINFDDLQSEQKYSAFKAYGISKLALTMITYEFARRFKDTGITFNAVHPGFISTNLGRDYNWFIRGMMKVMSKKPEKGAETSIYLASSPEVEGITGKYFASKQQKPSSDESYDETVASRLWDVSVELTHLDPA
jgi:NAD(P)-dependent dehydrogenase (short-subunit alcohol dehydrogenase family)